MGLDELIVMSFWVAFKMPSAKVKVMVSLFCFPTALLLRKFNLLETIVLDVLLHHNIIENI